MKQLILAYIIRKLSETTTWLGIIAAIAGATGISMTPELQNAIAVALVAIVSAILVAVNESKKVKNDAPPNACPPCVRDVDSPHDGDVVRTVEAHEADVPAVRGHDLHSDARPSVPAGTPRPVRPGFDRD